MIVGVGCDLVDSRRIAKLLNKYPGRFAKRILSESELMVFDSIADVNNRKISFLSKRFAAKEAVSKALGIGIGKDISFCDISVENTSEGAPFVKIPEHFRLSRQGYKIQISISDEWPMALAFVVISI